MFTRGNPHKIKNEEQGESQRINNVTQIIDMLVTIPAFGKQLQAEIPGLMGASGGALL